MAESASTDTLWGVGYGSPGFVAVGENGALLTSSDGGAWTNRSSGTTRWLLDVVWSPERTLFVAVGDEGTILTSTDGQGWTPRVSGTQQRLNSVAWGAEVFLVVGENGTALTSPDGITWTARSTGDAGWLRGLAFGNGTFVVTGHDGTILTTADRGATFQTRQSGTTRHLDAAAFLGGRFYVTGTSFVFASSADNGGTWSLDPRANADGRENVVTYNGIAAVNQALAIAGDLGRILDERGRLWPVTEPLEGDWRAIAAGRTSVVAVGTGGRIAFAPIDPNVPRATEIEIVGTTYLGDSPTLRAVAVRATPLAYRWSFNGEPIVGATSATLELPSLTQAQAGTYAVTTTFADGSSNSEVTVLPRPNPPTVNLVDESFRPVLTRSPAAVLAGSDGAVYVAGQEVAFTINGRSVEGPVRLRADGSTDPSFTVAPGSVPAGYLQKIMLQPDGRLMLLIRRYNFPPTEYRLVRLHPDGSLDASFRPDPALAAGGNLPTPMADGRWLGFTSDLDAARNRIVHVRRFRSDGTIDPTFAPHTLKASRPAPIIAPPIRQPSPVVTTTVDAQGRVYVSALHSGTIVISLGGDLTDVSMVYRLNPDGTSDETFTPATFRQIEFLRATSRGVIAQTVWRAFARPSQNVQITGLFRVRPDGTVDGAYAPSEDRVNLGSAASLPSFGLSRPAILADETIVAHAVNWAGHSGLVRFDHEGKLDPDFSAEIDAPAVQQISLPPVVLPNGRVLVAGSFTGINGVGQPFLARLIPNTRSGATALSNLSVRARVTVDPLIVGLVTKNGAKSILARGIGPALGAFGVTGTLEDPEVTVYAGTTALLANDNWDTAIAPRAAAVGAFPLVPGSRDAATLSTLPAGGYSIMISGKNSAGVALAEIYDNDGRPANALAPRLINLSVRTLAGTGSDTLTAGFTLSGDNTRTLLIRGVGQNLTTFGVPNVLSDPVLTVFRGSTPIASNDDWNKSEVDRERMGRLFAAVGAFPLANRVAKQDAALAIALTPGSYTVQLTGFNGATGQALLEIYEVP